MLKFAETYSHYDDNKLKSLYCSSYNDLREEAKEALVNELLRRNIKARTIDNSELIETEISNEELYRMVDQYRNCRCPNCGKEYSGINVYTLDYIYYIYVYAFFGKKTFVGCSSCLPAEIDGHMMLYRILMILLPVQTVLSIFYLRKGKRIIDEIRRANEPTRELYDYVHRNFKAIRNIVEEQKKLTIAST